MKDTVHTIRRSARRFFSGTLLSRISGMLRDMAMAYAFGTQPSIAAFMVAFRFAHLLRRLFGEGAMQSAFIPQFEALRQEEEGRAIAFFRDLAAALTLFLVFLIAFASVALFAVLAWADLRPSNQEVLYYTLLMLPSLLFICLFGLNASFLQCEKSYFTSAVAPVAFNVVWIIAVLLLKDLPIEQAIPKLCLAVIFASLAQWLTTARQTWKKIHTFLTFSPHPFQFRLSQDLRHIGKPLALGIFGMAASQINSAVDSLFARFAEPEGPAFLWFAIRIEQLPLSLFGIAIAGAVLPPLARAIKSNNRGDFHLFLDEALCRTWVFMLPLTGALFVLGDAAVALLYGKGGFDFISSIQTTYCLWAYGCGLIPSALVLVLAPACYAKSNYTLPAIASFASMFLNAALNLLFIAGFGYGAISVAIATSISAWINFAWLSFVLSRQQGSLYSNRFLQTIAPAAASALFAVLGTYWFRTRILELPFFSKTFFALSLFDQMLFFALAAFFFFALFFLGKMAFLKMRSRRFF